MADQKSFELFQVLPLPTSSTSFPSPKHDAVSNSYPPLYQLFSDNQLHGYGAVLLPDNNKLIGSSVPLGPFTGYASILKRSSFLKPAQQLLEDFFGSGFRVLEDPSTDDLSLGHSAWANYRVAYQFKKDSRLAFMLEELSYRFREAHASSTDRPIKSSDFQLVYQFKSETLEANGGRDPRSSSTENSNPSSRCNQPKSQHSISEGSRNLKQTL